MRRCVGLHRLCLLAEQQQPGRVGGARIQGYQQDEALGPATAE